MLRTTTKKARENIHAYIVKGFNPDNYGTFCGDPSSFHDAACFIWECFMREKVGSEEHFMRCGMSLQGLFEDWAAGLPSVLDTCYYYNRSAVDDLGDILQESEVEKADYSETQAERMLTYLIFREIIREVEG